MTVFGKFTNGAKAVVTGAMRSADQAQAPRAAEEHVLLALLDQSDSRAAVLLAGHHVPPDEVRAAYRDAARTGGLSRADAAALGGIGIDLDAVLAGIRPDGPPVGAGKREFLDDVRRVLTGAHREAVALGDRHLGDEHLLLALLAGGTVATDTLADHGVTYHGVRAQLGQLRSR